MYSEERQGRPPDQLKAWVPQLRTETRVNSIERSQNQAEDYVTPQKYLDGEEIPTFYQFQSNMVSADKFPPIPRDLTMSTQPSIVHISPNR